jgi:hypothetical protein
VVDVFVLIKIGVGTPLRRPCQFHNEIILASSRLLVKKLVTCHEHRICSRKMENNGRKFGKPAVSGPEDKKGFGGK